MDVILKVCNRPYDVVPSIRYWENVFKGDKYRVTILNDGVRDLDLKFPNTRIIDINGIAQRNYIGNIVRSNIVGSWNRAGMSHASTFYCATTNVFWNIDADDLLFMSAITPDLLTKIENYREEHDIFSFSWDMHWSCHVAFPEHPHHWSFGFNLSQNNKEKLVDILTTKPKDIPQWGTNIDYLFESSKDKYNIQSFLFKNEMVHQYHHSQFDGNKIHVWLADNRKYDMTCESYKSVIFGED